MHDNLEQILRKSGNRLTKPRLAVFDCLANSDTPLGVTEIGSAMTDLERTSIYRTIELYLRLQIITAVPHGWKQKYELAEPFKPHHHHFHCNNCNQVISLESPKIEHLIHQLVDEQQLTAISHTFEIHGLCSNCK